MHVKDKSCNHPKGLQLCLKETPTQVFSCEYSKSFRDAIFHRANPVTAVELCFSIRKEFSKRKFSGEFALSLISLIHVQIQLPAKRSTTTIAFVFLAKFADFFYHKRFEARSQWHLKHLHGPMWHLYNWRYKDLSLSCDEKVITLLTPME